MKKIKQIIILFMVMLIALTSLPLNALADNQEETLKTSQTEILGDKNSEDTSQSEEDESELIKKEEEKIDTEILEKTDVEEGEKPEKTDEKTEKEVEANNPVEKTETESENDTEDDSDKTAEIDDNNTEDKNQDDENPKDDDQEDKIESKDETKDDILVTDDKKETESIVKKLLARFSGAANRVSNILMDKKDVRLKQGLLIIKVTDRETPTLGLRSVKVSIKSLDDPTREPIEVKTNEYGVAFEWVPKGRYIIEQINKIPGYLAFVGEIEVNTKGLDFAKLINISNVNEDSTLQNYSYTFNAVDQDSNEGIEGIRVRISRKDDPSIYAIKTTNSKGQVVFTYLEENNVMIKPFIHGVDYEVKVESLPKAYGNNSEKNVLQTFHFENMDELNLIGNLTLKKKKKKNIIIHNVQELVEGDGMTNENIPVKGSQFNILDENKEVIAGPLTTNDNGKCSVELYEGNTYYIDQIALPRDQANSYYVVNDEIKKVELNSGTESEIRCLNKRLRRTTDTVKTSLYKNDINLEEGKTFKLMADGEKIVTQFRIDKLENDNWYVDGKDRKKLVFTKPKYDSKTKKEISYQINQCNDDGKVTNVFTSSEIGVAAENAWRHRKKEMFIITRNIHLDNPGDASGYTVTTHVKAVEEDYYPLRNIGVDTVLQTSQTEYVNGIENLSYKTVRREKVKTDDLYYNNIGGTYRFEDYDFFANGPEKDSYFEVKHRGSLKKEYRDEKVYKVLEKEVAKMKYYGFKYCYFGVGTAPAVYLSAPRPKLDNNSKVKPKLTLTKIDEADPNIKLENALFELYDENEKIVIDYKLTDENGIAVFEDLEDGVYHLIESQAPSGYKCNSKVRVEVKGGFVVGNEFITIDEEDVPIRGNGNILKDAGGTFRKNMIPKYRNPETGKLELVEKDVYLNGKRVPSFENLHQIDPQNTVAFDGHVELTEDARAGDSFKIKIDDKWKLGALNYPAFTHTQLKLPSGAIFANGSYDLDTNELTYTLTKAAERLYSKRCDFHFTSLSPRGAYDNQMGGIKANDRNKITIKFAKLREPQDGKYTKDITGYFVPNYINDTATLDTNFENLPYKFRTNFSQIVNNKQARIVSYVNMENYGNAPINGDTKFKLYSRYPGEHHTVYRNFSNVRVYKVPNHLKQRYITRSYGWIDEGITPPGLTLLNNWDIAVYNSFKSEGLFYSNGNTSPIEILNIDFEPRHFVNNEAYIVLNTVDLHNYRTGIDEDKYLGQAWGLFNGLWGIRLSQITGGGGAAGEPATKSSKLTLTNYQAKNIYFKKVDKKTHEELANAKFKLMKKEGLIWIDVEKYKEVYSDEDGEFGFVGLNKGEYRVMETEAPDGYFEPSSKKPIFKFNIERAEGTGELIAVPKSLDSEEDLEINPEDKYEITNIKKGVNINIRKTGQTEGNIQTGLNGVEFELKNEETNKVIDTVETESIDGRDGMIKFENIEVGRYLLIETKPLPGYKSKALRIIITENNGEQSIEYYEVVKDENGEYIELKAKNKKELAKMTTRKMLRSAPSLFRTRSLMNRSAVSLPKNAIEVSKDMTLVDVKYHTALNEDDSEIDGLETQIIKPHMGEVVALDLTINSNIDLREGDYFDLKIDNGLTPVGAVTLDPIELRNANGEVVAKSEFIKGKNGSGFENTYRFLITKKTYSGNLNAKAYLFVNRENVLFNSIYNKDTDGKYNVFKMYIRKYEDERNIHLKVDYSNFITPATTKLKQDAHFYITKIDKANRTYEAELFYTFLHEEKNAIGNINKNVEIIKATLISGKFQSNSLFNAMEQDVDFISLIDVNKTSTTTEFNFNEVWAKNNLAKKPIVVKVRGELGDIEENGQIGVRVGDDYRTYDISHLLDLIKDENSVDRGSVKVNYVYRPEDGIEVELLESKMAILNEPVGTKYNVANTHRIPLISNGNKGEYKLSYTYGNEEGYVSKKLTKIIYVYEKVVKKIPHGNVMIQYMFENETIKQGIRYFDENQPVGTKYDTTPYALQTIEIEKGKKYILKNIIGEEKGEITDKELFKQVVYEYGLDNENENKKGNVVGQYYIKGTVEKLKEDKNLFAEDVPVGTEYNSEVLEIPRIEYNGKTYVLTSIDGDSERGTITSERNYLRRVFLYEERIESGGDPDPVVPDVPEHKPEVIDPLKPVEIEISNYYNEKEFTKVDEGGEFLQGATFELRGPNNYAVTKVSDENGKIKFEKLGEGTYILKEIEAPEGYILTAGDLAKFEVDKYGNITDLNIGNKPITDTFENIEFEIPETGIDAIVPFVALGIIFIMASGSLYLKKFKNQKV